MERRKLLRHVLGFGFVATLLGTRQAMAAETEKAAPAGAEPPPGGWHAELTKRIAAIEARGGGALELGDGVYEIGEPLRLPMSVSLLMAPGAVLRARQGFQGEAVLIKGGGKYPRYSSAAGWIRGGVIDGGKQALTGIRVEKMHRLEIADLEVVDATFKGIHLMKGGNETNLSRVRVNLAADLRHAEGSIGIHYERGDSKVSNVHIIGYETGVRDDWGSNWFTLVHTWNTEPTQGPMKYGFYCNGGNDAFSMCYADSPTIAGFYINKPQHSVIQCSVLYSRWAPDNGGAGIHITPQGKHGTFLANDLYAGKENRMGKGFDGDLSSACILGTRYTKVSGGVENRLPSGERVLSGKAGAETTTEYPALSLAGGRIRLAQHAVEPSAEEGETGEVRWVDDGTNSALWVKTGKGWKASKLG